MFVAVVICVTVCSVIFESPGVKPYLLGHAFFLSPSSINSGALFTRSPRYIYVCVIFNTLTFLCSLAMVPPTDRGCTVDAARLSLHHHFSDTPVYPHAPPPQPPPPPVCFLTVCLVLPTAWLLVLCYRRRFICCCAADGYFFSMCVHNNAPGRFLL